MPRVVGTDPGTSSLDLLLLDDGRVSDQARLAPEALRDEPEALAALMNRWGPIDLVAGPSGYGLPLVDSANLTEAQVDLMALVRPDERGRAMGVIGFRGWVRALLATGVSAVFLPGGIHLPTIPPHRKVNAIDLGTADKVAVAALALHVHGPGSAFAVVEIGSAFSAVLVVEGGRIVDASAGTRGPIGLRSAGAMDGEAACWLSPLSKGDLFRGGLADLGDVGIDAFRESLLKHAASLKAATAFETIYLAGAGADRPEVAAAAIEALSRLGGVRPLPALPGAWVKHAAQGSALLADGLAGGGHAGLVESLGLRDASGSALDHLHIRPG